MLSAAARAAGAAPIYAGQPGYSRKLDRDGDGVAVEFAALSGHGGSSAERFQGGMREFMDVFGPPIALLTLILLVCGPRSQGECGW
nr:excalibur calcium-binding domain-containing protein [Rhodococcus sp. USK13]